MENKYVFDERDLDIMILETKNENIIVPIELDERIKMRISGLKIKKRFVSKTILSIAAVFLALVCLSVWIPSVKSFAENIPVVKDIIEWLGGDKGLYNALSHGYEQSEGITIDKDDYRLEINNIFADEARFAFSTRISWDKSLNMTDMYLEPDERAIIKHKLHNMNEELFSYSLFANKENYAESQAIKWFKQGELQEFINSGKDHVNLDVSLVKVKLPTEMKGDFIHQMLDEGNGVKVCEFKDISIPISITSLQQSKIYDINKKFSVNMPDNSKTQVDITSLTVSPTVMVLFFNTPGIDGKTKGLYEMKYINIFGNDKTCLPINDAYGFVYFTDYNETEGYGISFAPSLYFDGIPQEIDLNIDGIVFYETGGPEYTLDLKNDTFPKTIEYKGLKLVIKKAWYENGYLNFSLDPQEGSTEAGRFSHLNFNIKGIEQPIRSGITKNPGLQGITQLSIEADERDVYEIVTLSHSYLVNVNQKLKLNLKQR